MGKASRLKVERTAEGTGKGAIASPKSAVVTKSGEMTHYNPTNGLALSTRNRSKDYGDFVTGLLHVGASTSDAIGTGPDPAVVRVRDIVAGVPVLWWRLDTDATLHQDSAVMDVVGLMQSIALASTEMDDSAFPMAPDRVESIGFSATGGSLKITSHVLDLRLLGAQEFAIDRRLAWFLALTQTLSVVIETPSHTYVSTVTSDGQAPRVVVHDGTVHMKDFEAIIQRSANWSPVIVGNTSLLAGSADIPDHHRRTYSATSQLIDIPDRLSKRKTCLACGSRGDSREHCVPKWIANDQGVPPVIAPIFCGSCNGHFGSSLEVPISVAYRGGQLDTVLRSETFHQWALKTSLALSAASDVNIDDTWMRALRNEQTPEGFQIFALADVWMEPGYVFSVTHFSRSIRESGQFLFTFSISGLVFVVLRHPELIEVPGLMRVLPLLETADPPNALDVVALHDAVMKLMTGHDVRRVESSLRPRS